MRIPLLLTLALLLAGGEEAPPAPILLPPADPVHTPLPAGLHLAFDPLPRRPRLGETVRLTLRITAGSQPADLLWEDGSPTVSRRLTAPDGSVAEEVPDTKHRYGWSGVTRLQPGQSVQAQVLARIGRVPSGPGRYQFSVFVDVGWGAERPADPRRTDIDIDWQQPAPAEIPGIIDAQFALREDTGEADRSALSHPLFAAELTRRALAGSYQALQVLGETPGPEAAKGLLALVERMPKQWTDLSEGDQPNIAFCLFSRLADHLPPRKLPHQKSWWENPEAVWRRQTMTGVPTTFLPLVRAAVLPWIGRTDWGVAEVLTWSAQPEDRALLLATITKLADPDPPPSNHMHTLWQYAYAALLADPDAPIPDPATGIGEAMVWACHRCNSPAPWSESDEVRSRALLGSTDALRRRIGLWGLPRPLPTTMIPLVVELMRPGTVGPKEIADSALWVAHTTPDPRIWDAMLEIARDPGLHEDHTIVPVLVAAGRRVELARAVAERCRANGQRGLDSFRTFSASCLGVQPIFLYGGRVHTLTSNEQWEVAAGTWLTWLAIHGPAIAADGPLPPGDRRQPNHLLGPTWWFEAPDGRRYFNPGPEL